MAFGGTLLGISVLGFSVLFRTIALLLVAALPIRVSTINGDEFEGDFRGVEGNTLLVETSDGVQSFSFDDLQSIAPAEKDDEATPPKFRVTLSGGSLIAVQDLSLANEKLSIDPRRQAQLSVPLKEVKSIRFRPASPSTDPQWLGLLAQDARGDLLAIRRASGQIDRVPGLVEAIANGNVAFNMEGDTVQAPIEKLEGVVFGGARGGDPIAKLQMVDKYGSRWAVVSLEPCSKDGPLVCKLSDSVTHSVPLDHLESIFFSGGLTLLASQPPVESRFKPYLKTEVSEKLLDAWFAPKTDGDDIVMNGGGSIQFRIDGAYTTLAGSVRREQIVDKAGVVAVKIMVDDKEAWSEKLLDSDTRGFELSVKGARRISIVADSGDDGDVGDIVRITRPRLLK